MSKTFLKSKQGNAVIDTMVIIIAIFAISIAAMALYSPLQDINTDIQADLEMSNQSKEIIQDTDDLYVNFWDGVIVFLVVMLWLGSLIAGFFIDSHPVFFVIAFLLLVFVFYIAAILANEHAEIRTDVGFKELGATQTKTNFIMDHMVETGIFIGFTVSIVIYGKFRFG